MPQSMYVIIALMILSLFVYHQRRTAIEMQGAMVQSAVEVLGNGVAVERLSRIRSMSFDQATKGIFIDAPAKLTLPANFGPNQDMANDDVDDFGGALQDIYRVVGTDSLGFRVASYVTYASENDPSQGVVGPTKYKKVTVKVYSLDLADADTVRISQALSCKNACNW